MIFFQGCNSGSSIGSHGMWSLYHNIMQKTATTSTTEHVSVEQEVSSYFLEGLLSPQDNVLQYWRNRKIFNRLRQLVPQYLSIPPATVSSERLFSTAGLICDKKRSRLDPQRVQMLVFLNKNLT